MKGFKFQPYVWNRCHDLLMMCLNLSNIAILNIKGSNYHCIIKGISKKETAFGLNTEIYFVSLRIQSECGKIRIRKNSVFGHFSRSAI